MIAACGIVVRSLRTPPREALIPAARFPPARLSSVQPKPVQKLNIDMKVLVCLIQPCRTVLLKDTYSLPIC